VAGSTGGTEGRPQRAASLAPPFWPRSAVWPAWRRAGPERAGLPTRRASYVAAGEGEPDGAGVDGGALGGIVGKTIGGCGGIVADGAG
jgi:hypothetical protein